MYVCVCVCVCVFFVVVFFLLCPTCRNLKLSLASSDELPPAVWWNEDCDRSLLAGIIKHGGCARSGTCMGTYVHISLLWQLQL